MNDLPTDLFNHVLSFRETYREKLLRCFDETLKDADKWAETSAVPGNYEDDFVIRNWGCRLTAEYGNGRIYSLELYIQCTDMMSVTFLVHTDEFSDLRWELEAYFQKNFSNFDDFMEL